MSPLPPITTIFMANLLVCRPQVGAEFVTAVNLRHPSDIRRLTVDYAAGTQYIIGAVTEDRTESLDVARGAATAAVGSVPLFSAMARGVPRTTSQGPQGA